MTAAANDTMTINNLHYKFAIKMKGGYIAVNSEGTYYITSEEKKAEARWDIRGALAIKERYITATWNKTMDEDKPTGEVVEVYRPQRFNHWW